MKLLRTTLALALTPAFLIAPTLDLAHADTPRPVRPTVTSTPIGGVDPAAAAEGPAAAGRPEVLTAALPRARFTVAGVSWAAGAALTSATVTVAVRLKETAGWTGWQPLTVPDDGPDRATAEAADARGGTSPIVTAGATAIQVRVDTATGATPPDLKVTTIDPGTSPADDDLTRTGPAAAADAAARQPTIITRAQWGADEKLRGTTSYSTTVKAVVIHHTAGTNSYSPATAAAQVRGIYAYDTLGLGWSDIAYNFLVDKWGRVYEGRAGSLTKAVRGAHAMGFNTDTMGIAALGNYETAPAPTVMVDAMAKVAGWKLSQYGVNPAGTVTLTSQGGTGTKYRAGTRASLPAVNAHQNTSYTLCPGRYLLPQMGALRAKAATYARYSSLTAPAPAPVAVPTAKLYATYGTLTLRAGSTGAAVRDAQRELTRRRFSPGTADGAFGAKTTAAVLAFQRAAVLAPTGVIAANDWKALSGLAYARTGAPPAPPAPARAAAGFDADGRADLLGRTADGGLYLYPGRVRAFAKPVRIGSGWNVYTEVFASPDFTGDGRTDVFGRRSNGDVYLYAGNGRGGFSGPGRRVGAGWQGFNTVLAPGDVTGDRRADLLARRPDGRLAVYAGNGSGGFAGPGRQVGTGWQMFTQLAAPGDFTGDGRADLMGRTRSGLLYLYAGTGNGFRAGVVIGRDGWQRFNTVLGVGDLTGDGKGDLLGRYPDGSSWVYPGNGKGGFAGARVRVSAPWGATTRIFGAR